MFLIANKRTGETLAIFQTWALADDWLPYYLAMYDCAIYGEIK